MNKSVLAYDYMCRKVLADKSILSYLLKISLKEYEGYTLAEIAPLIEGNVCINESMHTIFPRRNEIVKEQGKMAYDLLFTTRLPKSANWMDLIVNVELQNDAYPKSRDGKKYPILKRGIYYSCNTIVDEKGNVFVKDNYQDLKKVISIWINTKPPKHKENSMVEYTFNEKHVGGRKYKEETKNYDLLKVVMVNLGKEEDYEVLGPLNELFVKENDARTKYKNLKEKYGIEVSEETKGEIEEMCTLGEELIEKGMKRGLAQGMERGLAQGIERGMERGLAQGIENEKIANIKTLMETMDTSYEVVVSLLRLSEEDKIKYRELVCN